MTGRPNRPVIDRFEEKFTPEPMSGCWLWTASLYASGYGSFLLKGKNSNAHRIAWELFKGPIPDGLWVLHKCDVRSCVNPDHLFLGTNQDNVTDMVRKGRHGHGEVKGEAHYHAKLTVADVLAIRADTRAAGMVAQELGVSRPTVAAVRCGRNWSHVQLENPEGEE